LRSKGHGRDDAHTDDARAARVAHLKAAGLSDGMIARMASSSSSSSEKSRPDQGKGGISASSSATSSALSSSSQAALLRNKGHADADNDRALRIEKLKAAGFSDGMIDKMIAREFKEKPEPSQSKRTSSL
jgi:hypothetical protein